MRRTGEIVLTVIGAILYAFVTFSGILLIWIQNNKEVLRDAAEDEALQEEGISMAEFNEALKALDEAGSGGWILAILAGIAVIIGIIAIVFLKGNKKPKPAGILLIIVAVVSLLMIGLGSWVLTLPYVIAGIMALARKPKESTVI